MFVSIEVGLSVEKKKLKDYMSKQIIFGKARKTGAS